MELQPTRTAEFDVDPILDALADAVTVQAADGRVIYANEAAARLYEIPRGAALDGFSTTAYLRDYDVTDDAGRPLELERMPGRLALAGQMAEPITIRAVDRRTGVVTWARIKATAVHGPDDEVRFAINVIEDVTELKRSEETQRFLAEASRRLASLDADLTLAAVPDLAVPGLADTCTVRPGEGAATRTVGALELVLPLRAGGRTLGTLTLQRGERAFDRYDVRVAEDFALRVAAAMENARLYRVAREIAQALQTSLLPPVLPEIAGATLAAAYHPAREGLDVGGDFYDVFSTSEGQWYLVIGDVCGKGAEAAAVTALARHTLRSAAARRRSPAGILRWVSEAMLAAGDDRFCTIACVHLDCARPVPRATVACGGHPLPVVRRADGEVVLFGAPGTLLGIVGEVELAERSTDLRPGDTLVLYTDGLTEARAPRAVWDDEELLAAVQRAPLNGPVGLVDSLVASALGDRASPRDDLAVLALKVDE